MKTTAIMVTLLSVLLVSQSAAADDRRHRRGYDSHGYSNHYKRYDHRRYDRHSYKRHYTNRYNPYHYGYRRGSSINISYGNHYSRRHNHDAGYFVGGLVLGSLLSYPRYSPPPVERVIYRSAPAVHTREVVVVRNSTQTATSIASGRRLLRDLEGNCFERVMDQAGNEIRVQLEAEACSF